MNVTGYMVTLPVLDPTIALALRASIALLFAAAAFHKIADHAKFRATLATYEVLPKRLTGVAAPVVVALEIAIAGGLLMPGLYAIASSTAAALLVGYTSAIAVNLARGRRDMDCGCGGPSMRQPIGPGLLLRNAVLIVAALAAGAPMAARALVWIDAVALTATLACAALLWTAANGLLALHSSQSAQARRLETHS